MPKKETDPTNQSVCRMRTDWHHTFDCHNFEEILRGGHCEQRTVNPRNNISNPMNIFIRTLPLAVLLAVAWSCGGPQPQKEAALSALPRALPVATPTQEVDYTISRRGKILGARSLPAVFTPARVDTLEFPVIDDRLALALQHQLRVLEAAGPETFRFGERVVHKAEMAQVIQYLLERKGLAPMDAELFLDAVQSWGRDRRGHVRMTGYFAPVLKVRKQKSEKYWYPIYSYPDEWEGPLPSRAQIDGAGALEGKAKVVAWAEDPVDVYYLQLQGSGYATFVDSGEKYVLAFDGTNGHPYRSIEAWLMKHKDLRVSNLTIEGIKRFLKQHPEWRDSVLFANPSYVFFRLRKGVIKGAGGVPLMEDISVAADPDYFPLGSVLLAWMPQYDRKGRLAGHKFTILLPQDTGGAIRGAGHLDVFSGVGKSGERKASMRHHYGRVWVLLPRSRGQLAFQPVVLP